MKGRIKEGEKTPMHEWWAARKTRHAVQQEFISKGYVKTVNGAKDRMLSLIERMYRPNDY